MSDKPKSEEPHYAGPIICIAPKIGDLMEDYLLGELKPGDAAEFREHLLLCFKCQDIYSSFQAVFENMRSKRAGQSERKRPNRSGPVE